MENLINNSKFVTKCEVFGYSYIMTNVNGIHSAFALIQMYEISSIFQDKVY